MDKGFNQTNYHLVIKCQECDFELDDYLKNSEVQGYAHTIETGHKVDINVGFITQFK